MEEHFKKIFKDLVDDEHFEAFEDYFDELVEEDTVIEVYKHQIVERFKSQYVGQWQSGAEYAAFILKRNFKNVSRSNYINNLICHLLIFCDYNAVWEDFENAGAIQTENGYIFDPN